MDKKVKEECEHEVPILGYGSHDDEPDEGPCEKCDKWCIFLDGKWVTEEFAYHK